MRGITKTQSRPPARRLYDDLYTGRKRAAQAIAALFLLTGLWLTTCSGTSVGQAGGDQHTFNDTQDEPLTFAPTLEMTTAPKMASSGHEWPFSATPDKQVVGAGARITDKYGPRVHPITGEADFHYGVDIAVPRGTPVKPLAPGVITFVGMAGPGGLKITVSHADGYETDYMHLQRAYVRVGQQVERNTEIAESGSSGRSTGPHVHFGARKDHRPVPPAVIVEWAMARYGDL